MIFYNFKGVNPSRRHKKTHTHLTAETPKNVKQELTELTKKYTRYQKNRWRVQYF